MRLPARTLYCVGVILVRDNVGKQIVSSASSLRACLGIKEVRYTQVGDFRSIWSEMLGGIFSWSRLRK